MKVFEREVTFDAGGLRLAGTITAPQSGRALGSVLLLSGSGPQDRDESVAGHKPFKVLAAGLSGSGYRVLRWDDCGMGGSQGDCLAGSSDVLVSNVIAGMDCLERAADFERHVLIGHSQGALIAGRVARRKPGRVAGIALLAGMGRPGPEVLLEQHVRICRAEGMSQEDIDATVAQKRRLFAILSRTQVSLDSGVDDVRVLTDARRELQQTLTGGVDLAAFAAADRDAVEEALEDLLEWEWRFLLTADPRDDLAGVRCPVLAMAGDKDLQVNAHEDLAHMTQALRQGGNERVTTRILAGHNHFFQRCSSGALSAYESSGPPFTDEATDIVLEWLAAVTAD